MTDILVTSPYQPFTLPTQFKAVFNGYIYCGTVDAVDPSVSQVQVYLVNEAGDKVPVAQPLRTNAGGFLVYNGQPAKFVTDSNHSLLVRDSLGSHIWYEPNMAVIDPETAISYIEEIIDGISSKSYDGIRSYSGYSQIISCYGRTNIFDNSAGEFYLDANDTTSADNDCTILVGVGGKRWKRKYGVLDGVLVDWAGADPTGTTPSDTAFSKAVSAGLGIRINGNYVVNSPIVFTSGNGYFIKGTNRISDSVTKTNLSAPGITRTYGGVPFAYDVPCIFAFVADDESYVRHVFVENFGTFGLEGDLTQVHFFAPKATYCSFRNMLGTHGKSFWESTVNGFINSFENVRTALMSKHMKVQNSNAYTLVNFYANGNPAGGDSVAFDFTNTNASFVSCDCDGLNIGWIADGHSNLEVIGSNSEARLRIFNARGDSSINIHGGRHALSVNTSQQSQEATPYRAEGNARINVIGAKAHKFVFNATPTNKFLAIATGTSKVSMSDMQLNVGSESAAETFSINDILSTSFGEVVLTAGGDVVAREIASSQAENLRFSSEKEIKKEVDFSSGASKTLFSISGVEYNQIVIADADVIYRSSGNNGLVSVGGLSSIKIAASTRNQNTANIDASTALISPDAGGASIAFSVSTNGSSISVIATASTTSIGICSFSIKIKAVTVNENRTSEKISIS